MKKITAILMVTLLVVALAASTASAASSDFVLDRLAKQKNQVEATTPAKGEAASKESKPWPKPGTPEWRALWH